MPREKILIIDFGSQYNQLIARKVRELNIFCEILPPDFSVKSINPKEVKGIIFSGGPASVYSRAAPKCDSRVFSLGIPILGICYGMQLMSKMLGGDVAKSRRREYGRSPLSITNDRLLFQDTPRSSISWMSHGDKVRKMPRGFVRIANSPNTSIAAFADFDRKLFGVQFHPEVAHTEYGKKILKNFLEL